MVEHESNALSIPVWKTGVYLSTPMLGVNPLILAILLMGCWNLSRRGLVSYFFYKTFAAA